jgi:hypothetical protein
VHPERRAIEVDDHEREEELEHRRAAGVERALGERYPPEHGLEPVRDLRIELRRHPDRRALVDVEAPDLARDLGDDLDRAGAGADDRDPLAGELIVVVPAGGVDELALEVVEAFEIRRLRVDERADRADHEPGGHLLTVHREPPEVGVLVPGSRGDLAGQADVRSQPVLVDVVVDIGLDLVPLREESRPVVLELVRELVSAGRDVDADAGIRVVAPRAAHVVRALEDREVVHARVEQGGAHPEPADAGADDRDLVVGRRCLRSGAVRADPCRRSHRATIAGRGAGAPAGAAPGAASDSRRGVAVATRTRQ